MQLYESFMCLGIMFGLQEMWAEVGWDVNIG